MTKYFLLCTTLLLTIGSYLQGIPTSQEIKKNRMIQELEVIKHVLEMGYAPTEWKRNYAGWDLNEAMAKSKEAILRIDKITTRHFQQILRHFLGTTKDYHVSAFFLSTEAATLPFTVKSVNGRYFIDWIDEQKLSPSVYSINRGDELIQFDGRPIDEVVNGLKLAAGRFSNRQTDQALAELSLTFRSGERGDLVPKGSVNILIQALTTHKLHSYQLMWSYVPEAVKPLSTHMRSLCLDSTPRKKLCQKKSFYNPIAQLYHHPLRTENRLGDYQSFIPNLGEVLYLFEGSSFYAYIYQNEDDQNIGYIRIPHYRLTGINLELFGDIIEFFQENTEALVIDQVDNPGGFVESQYLLASMLTDYPLVTPKHRIMINQQDVMDAYQMLEVLELIHSDEEAESLFFVGGIFKTYQYVLFLKEYYRFIIDEWNTGRLLTDPIHIEGVDQINPHPSICYSKPILMLINELDFSGGDFLPAIMQDNKRALLFGARTAGAGGYVKLFTFPNQDALAGFSYTASIAERVNQQPIENLGVSPDIPYQITEDDLQNNYRSYVEHVNEAVRQLLSPSPKKGDTAHEE